MTAPSLAEIVKEGERQIANYQTMILPHGDARRLLAVAKAASAIFAALDHVTPGWRETTCVIDEDSDEVNVAWCGLENALDNPKAGQPPEAF